MNKLQYIICHHTALSYKEYPDQFDVVNNYHKAKWNMRSALGFFGGYNYIISAKGQVRQYRADGEETMGAKGYNLNSLHVALEGNFDLETPTIEQENALKNLLNQKLRQYNILPQNIDTHRMFRQTSCPGSNISEKWLRDLFQPDIPYLQAILNNLKEWLLKLRGKLGSVERIKDDEFI